MKTYILTIYRSVYSEDVSPFSGTLATTIYKTFEEAFNYVEKLLDSRTNTEISCYYDVLVAKNRLKRLYILKKNDGYETFFIDIDWGIVI